MTAEVEGKEHKESYDKLIFATGSTPICLQSKVLKSLRATANSKQLLKMYNLLNCTKTLKKLLKT